MTPRLVATDLDGTLLRSDKRVSTRTLAALTGARRGGATIVVVTGRPVRWLDGPLEQIGRDELVICANGAVVYEPATERLLTTHLLGIEAARGAVDHLRRVFPGTSFAAEYGRDVVVTAGWANDRVFDEPLPEVPVDRLTERPMTKLLARRADLHAHELAAELDRSAVALSTESTWSWDGLNSLLEIGPAGVHKGSALAELCAERDIAADDVVAFGDMPNDSGMLAWAGLGVAMGNAHSSVAAIADRVTSSNDDDGVAVVLEELFGLV